MAKADVTQIAGYDDMTPEQKVAALEAYEFDDNAVALAKAQAAVTKANAEAAEWKRKHNLLLSEEDQTKAAAYEEKEAMAKRIAELETKEVISSYKEHFMEAGYDAALALDTATALAENDVAKVFANQKKFLESHDKAYKAQLMGGSNLDPASGNTGDATGAYEKLLAEAKEKGDPTAIAYYTRILQQSKK